MILNLYYLLNLLSTELVVPVLHLDTWSCWSSAAFEFIALTATFPVFIRLDSTETIGTRLLAHLLALNLIHWITGSRTMASLLKTTEKHLR